MAIPIALAVGVGSMALDALTKLADSAQGKAAESSATLSAKPAGKTQAKDKAAETAQDFEAVFLNAMMQNMMTGVEGEGPFGGGPSTGVWRSFMTEEYAKSFAKNGGVGIGNDVLRTLIEQQAADGSKPTGITEPQKS